MISEAQSKANLRKQLMFARKTIVKRADKNSEIFKNLTDMPEYKNAKQILMYMALDNEVNIDSLVDYSIMNGKSVAVPYCINADGSMEFYYINNTENLISGSFGIREPDISVCKKVTDFSDSIVIVPAIAFDTNGYRLGYGKGYYDRFLKNYSFISVGLCYNSLIQKSLPINEYDQKVDYIVTDTRIIRVDNGGQNNG